MICVCRANYKVCNKTVPPNWHYPKVNIKSTKRAKCLLFGTVRGKISTFVIQFPTNLPLFSEPQFGSQVKFNFLWNSFVAHCTCND